MADRAFDTAVESTFLTLDANFEAFTDGTDAIVQQFVYGETGTLVFHTDAAGTTDDVEISIVQGHRVSNGNGLDGTTSTTDYELNTSADAFTTDDDMNGKYLVMTSGDEQGEMRLITDSVAADDGVVLDHAFSAQSSAAETYALYSASEYKFQIDMSSAIGETNPLNAKISVSWANGEFLLVRARATGSTDAHRIQMSYARDSGPA